FKTICFERLDRALNDHMLALEVLAAFSAHRKTEVDEYVQTRLAVNEPAQKCRALMVAGFSDVNPEAEAVLRLFEGAKGFIGTARKAARNAYERNVWAREWYARMLKADEPLDFWRYSVLLGKVVDGRYVLWRQPADRTKTSDAFMPTVAAQIERRIKKWHNNR